LSGLAPAIVYSPNGGEGDDCVPQVQSNVAEVNKISLRRDMNHE